MRFEKGSDARPLCACPGLAARSGTVLSTHIEDPRYLTVYMSKGKIVFKFKRLLNKRIIGQKSTKCNRLMLNVTPDWA